MSMFRVTIKTVNAAFEGDRNAELARILLEVAARLSSASADHGVCWDINGNNVGSYAFED